MFCLLSLFMILVSSIQADYWTDRQNIIHNEEIRSIGGCLNLSNKELLVNKQLMEVKLKEMTHGFQHPQDFLPAKHFFQARTDIENSAVFKFIQKMPKGGALHVHDLALCSTDYVLKNITYRDNLYASITGEDILLKFSNSPPNRNWTLLSNIRQRDADFDVLLRSKISLIVDNPSEKYPDVNTVWNAFSKLFITLGPLLTYRPVFEDYFDNALNEFYRDNVHYIEIRGTLPEVYDLTGKIYGPIQVMGILKNVADRFLASHPDFIGIKYIYAPLRSVNNNTMDEYIKIYKKLKDIYPDFLAGFDLVGQEDLGEPLSEFVTKLISFPKGTKFYFHAGETNWYGTSTDFNLVDAILLNATRIGHGYALVKHPIVSEQIKQKNIGIEINPISNQVLNLVKDLRNHPANILIGNNYPVVISSDDPGLWGASALSHDFYEAFMGMARKTADLRLLKQLAINSIKYSSLDDKNIAFTKFLNKWYEFINSSLNNNKK